MPTVLVTPENFLDNPGPFVDVLKEGGFDIRYPQQRQFARGFASEAETIAELKGASAVIAGGEFFTDAVLAAVPELRVIARSGVGYDRVDVEAATKRGVPVTITPTANHEAVAELALALLFAVTKSIVTHDKVTRAGEWPREPLRPIRKQTMGIVGLGRIGRSMAVRCAAMGMTVLTHEKYPNEQFIREHGIELLDLDTLLARSDYVSVHCPLNDETQGLFNKDRFAQMKPGSVLINTARGGLVVEEALLEALTSGHLAGAGLDVFEQEPPSPDNPLFALDNIVVSPHIAGADWLSARDMGTEAAQCIVRLSRGDWPEGAVINDELKSSWKW